MRAIEVYVNGKRVCTAGVPATGWLSASVNCNAPAREGTSGGMLSIQGQDGAEVVVWPVRMVEPSDEVTIRFCEADAVDQPSLRRPVEPLGPEP
jgi:hypothetical protein